MLEKSVQSFIAKVLENLPEDWLRLTTHRLDIYNEALAKTQFIEDFEALYQKNIVDKAALAQLPTAYDYIRLGHPLSSILEWAIARTHQLKSEQVISFSSRIMPVLAILRQNALENKATHIYTTEQLPSFFDADLIREVYDYSFELHEVKAIEAVSAQKGSTVFLTQGAEITGADLQHPVDYYIRVYPEAGSIMVMNGALHMDQVAAIQHVRRRETIAMTPADCLKQLQRLTGQSIEEVAKDTPAHKKQLIESIQSITNTDSKAVVASSGLSMQYAIMMGLVHHARENHQGKAIKFIVPPNCYGGTNDQARRIAASLADVEVVDFPVDAGHDMVSSIDTILDQIATDDAVPYIIAEIPTNPRVEVPDLEKLSAALSKSRKNPAGTDSISPVFILDQTFCPNVHFLGEGDVLSSVSTLSYVSGSKFPSGGLCTAGYCVANKKAEELLDKIATHLLLCDNEATALQYEILAKQMPSMIQRIEGAYQYTRTFVNYIEEILPEANINFVSEELAEQGFTPSVFSLDLPTKGDDEVAREAYKRELNLKLIQLMINEIPNESKYCVSYGQLKGCYWTIPATSTQGTTKEGDKDYIVRVALSSNMDLEHHKWVFSKFVAGIE